MPVSMPMRRIPSCCCAFAASGQKITAPPKNVMNWRRLMSPSRLGLCIVARQTRRLEAKAQLWANSGLFAIDGIPNCACHYAIDPHVDAMRSGDEYAATLWQPQITSDAMSLDARGDG
jgi:hypothetical protein